MLTRFREYTSLNCFVYSDVNQYIFNPRHVSNIINYENSSNNFIVYFMRSLLALYEKFFESVKTKYNAGQLEAIKDVCLSRNGICLLQGPVLIFLLK